LPPLLSFINNKYKPKESFVKKYLLIINNFYLREVLDKAVLRPNSHFVTFGEAFGMFSGMDRAGKGLSGIAEMIVPDL